MPMAGCSDLAPSMKPGPALEIIEIIDDDNQAVGGQLTAPRPPPENDRRWVGPVAATALLLAIGYGVVSSAISTASSNSRPTASLPPTAATGSSISGARTVNLVSPQFYVADQVPSGFSMHFAETLGMGGNPADFTDGTTAQLWATAGAAANNGSWFEVSRGTHHSTGRNSYRTIVAGTNVVVEHDPSSGQSRLSFNKDGDALEITAFGWADRQLVRLVDSVFVRDSAIEFHDAFFATDHKRVLDADPASALYGLPVAWVGYTTAVPAALAESFTITVAGFVPEMRDAGIRFALINVQPFTVGSTAAVIGQSAADPRQTVIQWVDGDRLITVRGNVGVVELVSIAESVHAAPASSVAQQVQTDQPQVSALDGIRHSVGSGWLGDGPWVVQVSGDPIASNPDMSTERFVWWIGQPSATSAPSESRLSTPGPGPVIETFVENDTTYVLARVPRPMAGAKLHVNRNGLPSIELTTFDADTGLDAAFAAYAFTEAVPYAAQIVDVNGQTVAAWPPA